MISNSYLKNIFDHNNFRYGVFKVGYDTGMYKYEVRQPWNQPPPQVKTL